MKFHSIKPRLQNIFFHLHTVSGIVISFALFIIFYAGAFALFRKELIPWENSATRPKIAIKNYDIDAVLKNYTTKHPKFDATDNFSLWFYESNRNLMGIRGREKNREKSVGKKRTEGKKRPKRIFDKINLSDNNKIIKSKTTVGNTLYHLHYFGQIPQKIGMYLSSLVAFFFFMATVTGVILHWKNLSKKFYAIVTIGNWQKIWTNLHTVLGVLTIPFQLIYAITGAFFGLRILFFIPTIAILFGGDRKEAFKTISQQVRIKPDTTAVAVKTHFKIQPYLKKIKETKPVATVSRITLNRFGYEDARATFYFKTERQSITGNGNITYRLKTGEKIMEHLPENGSYIKGITNGLRGLHFANFGHLSLRVLFFLLAICCCFIIISGMLIWQKARDNGAYSEKQKRFHHWVTKIYLCICLGLVAAVPLFFIANKSIPLYLVGRLPLVKSIFFVGWSLFIFSGLFYKRHTAVMKHYLIFSGVMAFIVPLANGFATGDWFWETPLKMPFVFGVDAFWFVFSSIAFLTVWKHSRKNNNTLSIII